MSVPDNVRTQFSTSTINTGMNDKEETNKDSIYNDHIYPHTQDDRSVNVVQKVKEGIPYHAVEDDTVKKAEAPGYKDILTKTEAPGYKDILTKTEAAATYTPIETP